MMMEYDPALKEAMVEMAAIMDKYQIGGFVYLASKTHAEFRFHAPKTWGCLLSHSQGVGIRSKREDYPSSEAQHEALEESAHFLMRLIDSLSYVLTGMDILIKRLSQDIEIVHDSGGFVPDKKH